MGDDLFEQVVSDAVEFPLLEVQVDEDIPLSGEQQEGEHLVSEVTDCTRSIHWIEMGGERGNLE